MTEAQRVDDELRKRLSEGAAGRDGPLIDALGLEPDSEDSELAIRMVSRLMEHRLDAVLLDTPSESTTRPSDAAAHAPQRAADSSFLGRLTGDAEGVEGGISSLSDVVTLLLVWRAGSLMQRRAVLRRLRVQVESGDVSNDSLKLVRAALEDNDQVDVVYEVAMLRQSLPGADNRRARLAAEHMKSAVERMLDDVNRFWSAEISAEPFAQCAPDLRVKLITHLRDLPAGIVHHLSSIIEGTDGACSMMDRQALLSSLRYAADLRLLPALVGVLELRDPELTPDAVRALAHIDDPRVQPALARAYDYCVIDSERVTLAGALGVCGDVRGLEYVRTQLNSDDERMQGLAAEAMQSLATREDVDVLLPLLDQADSLMLSRLLRALARCGDARALGALRALRLTPAQSAVAIDLERACRALEASMELRGEELVEDTARLTLPPPTEVTWSEQRTHSFLVRARSAWEFLLGQVWGGLGSIKRATRYFERAAAHRPGWAAPLAANAMMYARTQRSAQALTVFRRALETDQHWVEAHASALRGLIGIFLLRADEVERAGRIDIARGLLDELVVLDLRRIPSELRFELMRRREALRRKKA